MFRAQQNRATRNWSLLCGRCRVHFSNNSRSKVMVTWKRVTDRVTHLSKSLQPVVPFIIFRRVARNAIPVLVEFNTTDLQDEQGQAALQPYMDVYCPPLTGRPATADQWLALSCTRTRFTNLFVIAKEHAVRAAILNIVANDSRMSTFQR